MRKRNAIIFALIVIVWVILDFASKAVFSNYEVGDVIAGPFLGLFQLTLVHNTGAAWGIFGESTLPLAILSILVCIFAALYLFVIAPDSNIGVAAGVSLVVAGGIGNAIDRFTQGFVVDFIEPVFIDFPVFNIADIGVTCGIIIFIISLIIEYSKNEDPGERGSVSSAHRGAHARIENSKEGHDRDA